MAVDYDTPGQKILKSQYLAHIVLKTTAENFCKMVKFYTTFVHISITFKNNIISFLTYDDEHHRIAIGIFPGTIPEVPGSAGLVHIAFAYRSISVYLALSYRQRKSL
jgi:catechol-2,3-dioxygenase